MSSASLHDGSELADFSNLQDSDKSPIINNDITNRETTAQNPDVEFVNEDKSRPSLKAYAIAIVLFLVNILNYMDRSIISGLSIRSVIKSLK